METLIVALILTGVVFAFYQRGKQAGGRAGFHAGRREDAATHFADGTGGHVDANE